MIASNSAPRLGTSQGRQKNGRVGVRKEGREKCHTFLGTNLRGETAATPSLFLPPSRVLPFNILRRAARFTVLLIRQRQLVSKDTLYINFGYCEGGVVHTTGFSPPMPFNPLPDSPVSLYCGFSVTQRGTPP